MMDRRDFTKALMLAAGAGLCGFPEAGWTSGEPERISGTVVVDAATGRVVHRSGVSSRRFSPCSTFKIPIAVMGFDAGILKDARNPAWDYRPGVHPASRDVDKQRTDPTMWEANSVVWYSQEITRRLGERRFKAYVDRFGYGNRDVRGNPGKHDGLTQSWLTSSLAISPDEQVAFLGKLVGDRLGVSAQAGRMARSILPLFEGSGGWSVHGKTGSGSLRDAAGGLDSAQRLGWFVGWADKGGRRLLFARVEAGRGMPDQPAGPVVRDGLLGMFGTLAG